MLIFGISAALICAVLAALIVLRAGEAERAAGGEDPAIAMHRRQLAEIDELSERGLMPEGEVRAAKAEAARRLLSSAERGEAVPPSRPARGVVLGAAFAAPVLTLGLYFLFGAPGTPDQPFLKRAAEWQANPVGREPVELAAAIAAMAPEKKGDPAFWRNLSMARLMAGQNALADQAARSGLRIDPDQAALWSLLGRARLAEPEKVTPGARAAFEQALLRDPKEQYSRYYLGLGDIQDGQVQSGLARWRAMLADLPPGATAETLRGQIDVVAATGRLPEAQPVNAADAAAAAGVDVNAMIEGLAARLKTTPDDPQGWARLVRAYAVLGDQAKLDAALSEARRIFAGRKDVLQAIEQAASAPQ